MTEITRDWLSPGAASILPAAEQKVYVNGLSGSDSTGTGSQQQPYATVIKAMTMITDATQNKPYAIMLGAARQIETADVFIKPYVFIVGEMQRASYFRINGGELKPHADFGTSTGWVGFKNLYFGGSSVINFDLSAFSGNGSLFIIENCTLSGNNTFKGRNAGAGDFVEMYENMILGTLTMDTTLFQINSTGISGTTSIANTLGFSGLSGSFLGSNFNGNLAVDGTGGAITIYSSSTPFGTASNTITTTASVTLQVDSESMPPVARQTLSVGTTLTYIDDASTDKYAPATPANWTSAPATVALALDAVALASKTASASTAGLLSSTDWSTFNGKQAALGFTPENVANKGAASGYCPLNASSLIDSTYLPSYVDDVIEVANYAALPSVGAFASVVYDTVTFTAVTKGTAGNSITLVFDGVADIDTIVNAWNLANPTNTVGFAGQAGTYVPAAGTPVFTGGINVAAETGKIYVAIDTSKQYRFGGTVYVELSPPPVVSVNTQTGAVVLDTDDISEPVTPTNKWFTDTRARTAAVVNTLAGSETDQAPSVFSVNSALSSLTSANPQSETVTLSAGDISNGYIDCAFIAVNGIVDVTPVGGPLQLVGTDYTLSTVSLKTRVTFAGDMATKLVAGKKVTLRYLK